MIIVGSELLAFSCVRSLAVGWARPYRAPVRAVQRDPGVRTLRGDAIGAILRATGRALMQPTLETNMATAPTASDTTSLALRPLSPNLGVEVTGIELAALDDPGFDRIYEAFLKHQMLLFRDQDLTPGEQVVLARRFGSVQVHVMNQYHAEGFSEIYHLSNLDASGRPSGKHPDKGTVHWHTDRRAWLHDDHPRSVGL
jgi:hypothetical protein